MVRVKFVGAIDSVVRRKAVAEGVKVPPGQSKQLVFRGYLVTIKGGVDITVATAIELGVSAIALWGVALLFEQYNSGREQWRLPTIQRLRGGVRLPASQVPVEGAGKTGFPAGPGRFVFSEFRDNESARARNTSVSNPTLTDFARYIAAKVEAHAKGVTHVSSAALVVPDDHVGQALPSNHWLAESQFISSMLRVVHWTPAGSFGVEVSDDWLSAQMGEFLVFAGGAKREAVYSGDTVSAGWYLRGLAPTPRLGLADDGGTLSNRYKYAITRESPLAYRQSCTAGVAVFDRPPPEPDTVPVRRLIVAAPAMVLRDDMYLLQGTWGSGGLGYTTTRSLLWAFGEFGASMAPEAGAPVLAIMRFGEAAVTAKEVESFADYSRTAPRGRYVCRLTASREIVGNPSGWVPGEPQDLSGQPREGAMAPQWAGASLVRLEDMPDWYQPAPLAARAAALNSVFGFGAEAAGFPVIVSDQRQTSALGAVYTTVVDGVVEFAFNVKALDDAVVGVGTARRSVEDWSEAPTQAAISVAKTGIVFVRTTAEGVGAPVVDDGFRDVIGPSDCPQFRPGMQLAYATLPQVRFACVLGTARAYAVRAVRYDRNPFLASALTASGNSASMPYTEGYAGRKNNSIGGPLFYTDREFGPYPDRAQFEELWFVVDRVKYVVNTTALDGTIEPVTEGKYVNAMRRVYMPLALYTPSAPTTVHRRQVFSMFSEADEKDFKLLDFYADEFAAAGMEMNTFAQVSDTDIVFVLHRSVRVGSRLDDTAVVCRFSSVDGSAVQVAAVPYTGPGRLYAAITCYQYELVEDGELVQPACLILRMGRGDDTGLVFTSVDAGLTWELLYDQASTRQLSPSGSIINAFGTPSMGLHIMGPIGSGGDPRYTIRRPKTEDSP